MNLLSDQPSRSGGRPLRQPAIVDIEPLTAGVDQKGNPWLESLDYIRRKKLWVALFCLSGLALAFATFIGVERQYSTMMTLELTGINEGFMNLGSVDPQAGTGNYSATTVTLATQLRILESASLRESVLERLDRELTPAADPQPDVFTRLRARLGLGIADPAQAMKAGIQRANGTFTAKQLSGTRILTLKCASSSPEIAAAFVNTVASEYISQGLQFRTSTAQKTTQWLSGQVEETRIKLEQAEKRLQEYVQKSGNLFVADQEPLANTKLRELQGDLSKIQADRIQKQTRYEMAKNSPPDSLPEVIEDSTIRGYQEKIADLRREQAVLLTTLMPAHYKVKRVAAQIGEMENTLKVERANLLGRIANEYEEARNREKLLSGAYAGQSRVVSSQASKAVEYGLVKREVDMLRSTLNMMLQQMNQATVATAVPTGNVRVVDRARPFAEPSSPLLSYYLTYGLGGGASFGIGLLVILDRIRKHGLSKKVNVPGHVSNLLKIPELGVIPSAQAIARAAWKGRLLPGKSGQKPPRDEAATNIELVMWDNKTSMLAESFRLVLTSLKFMEQSAGQPPRIMVVASPMSGEGKTMVASNMALAMAESGRSTLLIDADLRKPRLHNLFGLSNDTGFYELLTSEAPLTDAALTAAVQLPAIPNVAILPTGRPDLDNINRVFHSPRVLELLQLVRGQYDTILIDTPPLLSFSDARLLSFLADGAILVMRAGVTERESALAARMRLVEDGIHILGTILNDWDPGDKSHAYSSYYNYYLREHQ